MAEYLEIARECLYRRKTGGGVFGFPAALLLFTILDTIGSFHRGDTSFVVSVDGRSRTIDGDGFKHYFALNSTYYKQSLSEAQIRSLYDYYRCLLSHNSSLAPGKALELGMQNELAFGADTADSIVVVRLLPFYDLSTGAVHKFLLSVESVLMNSEQALAIHAKSSH